MTVQSPFAAEYASLRKRGWRPTEAWHHVLLDHALKVAEDAGLISFLWSADEDPDLSWLDQPDFEAEKAETMRKLRDGTWSIDTVTAWGRPHECASCGLRHEVVFGSLGGIIGDPDDPYRRSVEIDLAIEAGIISLPGKRNNAITEGPEGEAPVS